MTNPLNPRLDRRRFLKTSSAAGTLGLAAGTIFMPAISRAAQRPMITHGVMSGDVTADSAMIWARADRPARMLVDVAASDSFADARSLRGPDVVAAGDFCAKLDLRGLPSGETLNYRVRFLDLDTMNVQSEPVVGRLRTAPADRRDVSFVWSGDTAGQGWGIDVDRGGMLTYATMSENTPDFFIHSGDTIYADGPIAAEQKMPDGGVWRNVVIEEKAKVAETLAEFRGQWKYNLMDEHVRAFNAQVPLFMQWDDHEVRNNWYPGRRLDDDDRYTVKSASLLAARAVHAFHEFNPIRRNPLEDKRVYRKISYGPLLDIFFLDMRTYRGRNSANDQAARGPATDFLGREQIDWLKQALIASKATWKVIAADMPIGLMVRDGKEHFENSSNGDGPIRGREFDIAELLSFINRNAIANTVWLTADVHYTAAHYYDPNKAQFQDFAPFWEFVSGPLHAGSFGPNDLDNTFGPQVKFVKAPEKGRVNLPPSEGLQFFGHVRIDGATGTMTVTLKDRANQSLYVVDLTPKQSI